MFKKITWKSIGKVFKGNKPLRHSLRKLFHRQINTFEKCYQWNTSKTATCQLCQREKETVQHVLLCSQEDMTRVRNKFYATFKTLLTSIKTEPKLQQLLLHIIQNWNSSQRPLYSPDTNNFFEQQATTCFNSQACIGWKNFMQGIIFCGWIHIQSQYYQQQHFGVEFNEERWNKKVTESLLMHHREMWNEHCTIIKAENSATSDQRQRDAAYELCKSFRYKLNLFHPNHHHIFQKREHFFRSSKMDTIYMRQNEVYSAIKYEQPKTKQTITSFFPSSNQQPHNTQQDQQNTTQQQKKKPKQSKRTFLLQRNVP